MRYLDADEVETLTCLVGRHDWYYRWEAEPLPTRYCGRCRYWEELFPIIGNAWHWSSERQPV